jgi:5-methylcytosine-specific restriction endonuclease McrA
LDRTRARKLANPDYYKQKGRERRARSHEARLEWQRQWRAKNPELYLEQSREAYWREPEKFRKRSRDYSKNNPEKVLQINRRRKARLKNAAVSKYTEKQVLDLHGTDCHLCGKPIDMQAPRWTAMPGWELGLHIDHVIPIAKGGADSLDNVKPSHGFCNVSKNANPFLGAREK